MGNTASQTNLASSEVHSKSIPNIRSLSDEAERFYFEQAISIQEQFSYEKSLRMQHQFKNNNNRSNSSSNNENLFHRNNTNFHLVSRIKSTPDYTFSEDCKKHQQHEQRSNTISHNSACINNARSKKSARKLSKIFQKIGNQNTDNNLSLNRLTTATTQSRSMNRKTAMTKSLVIPNDSNDSKFGAKTARDYTNKKSLNSEMEEVDLASFGKNRLSIGTRLSCDDNLNSARPNYLNINTCVLIDEKNQLGSMEFNKSIDLNDSNLLDNTTTKLKYLNTHKYSAFNSSNNSSSSGCSSGASSSNLSTTRRVNHRPHSSLSTWSATKMSTPSPPPSNGINRANQNDSLQILALKNYSTALGPFLNSATSSKSILSEAKETDCSYFNKKQPVSNASSVKNSANENYHNRSFSKRLNTRANLIKSDSANSFSSILAMKPCLNTLQSSISSTGISCGFVSSEVSSISNSKPDTTLNYSGSVKLTKRAQNRFNKVKSESMYVREPVMRSSSPETKKLQKTKKSKKQRDSGILVDLFNINGSVSNLKTKFNNATSSLRNSISTFNLKSLSLKKRSKKSKSKYSSNAESDIDNEYENSDDNYNSNSDEEQFNEIYKPPGSFVNNKKLQTTTDSKINSMETNVSNELNDLKLSSSISANLLSECSSYRSTAKLVTTAAPVDNIKDNNYIKLNSNNSEIASQNNINNKIIKIVKNPNLTNNKTKMLVRSESSSISDFEQQKKQDEPSNDLNLTKKPFVSSFKPNSPVTPKKQPTNYSQQPQQQPQHKKIVVQASTNDLLNCFAQFIGQQCTHLSRETYVNPLCYMNSNIGKRIKFEPEDTINWLRSADCALLIQGWQEIAFMNPVNVVFVYLLVRDTLKTAETIRTVYDLQCNVMACLYLAFSYMGNEISYPLKPFLIEENRSIFWQRTCDLMSKLSGNMLRINQDPRYFTELFYELKSYSNLKKSVTSSSIQQNPITKNENDENINKNQIQKFQTHSSLLLEQIGSSTKTKHSISSQNNLNKRRSPPNAEHNSKTFYKSFENSRPNHKVIFSSNEPQAYCI